jgi:hypothetical protein
MVFCVAFTAFLIILKILSNEEKRVLQDHHITAIAYNTNGRRIAVVFFVSDDRRGGHR